MNKKIINLLINTSQIKGAEFIGVSGYVSKSGEKADYVVNGGISVKSAKEKDLETLKTADLKTIKFSSDTEPFSTEALQALIDSSVQNLSPKIEDHTAQSQAQTDAYQLVTPSIKLHVENDEFHIHGLVVSKTVPEKYFAENEKAFKEYIELNGKGVIEHKTNGQPVLHIQVNSKPLTRAKNAISRTLDLRSTKFRNFIVPQSAKVAVHGTKIEFKV